MTEESMPKENDVEFELLPDVPKKEGLLAIPIITEEHVIAAERAIGYILRIKAAALRVTSRRDWVNMRTPDGDKPYLQESGCSKVAQLFGISFSKPEIEVKRYDRDGDVVEQYICKLSGTIRTSSGDRTISNEGIASTDDKMFGSDGHGGIKPFSEVDKNSVRKKAITNAMGRILRQMLGLNNITWEELALSGIKNEFVKSIEYKQTPEAKAVQKADTESEGPVDYRKGLWDMLLVLANGDKALAHRGCEKYSSFEFGKGQIKKGFTDPLEPRVPEKWVKSTYWKVKRLVEAKQREASKPPPEPPPPPPPEEPQYVEEEKDLPPWET